MSFSGKQWRMPKNLIEERQDFNVMQVTTPEKYFSSLKKRSSSLSNGKDRSSSKEKQKQQTKEASPNSKEKFKTPNKNNVSTDVKKQSSSQNGLSKSQQNKGSVQNQSNKKGSRQNSMTTSQEDEKKNMLLTGNNMVLKSANNKSKSSSNKNNQQNSSNNNNNSPPKDNNIKKILSSKQMAAQLVGSSSGSDNEAPPQKNGKNGKSEEDKANQKFLQEKSKSQKEQQNILSQSVQKQQNQNQNANQNQNLQQNQNQQRINNQNNPNLQQSKIMEVKFKEDDVSHVPEVLKQFGAKSLCRHQTIQTPNVYVAAILVNDENNNTFCVMVQSVVGQEVYHKFALKQDTKSVISENQNEGTLNAVPFKAKNLYSYQISADGELYLFEHGVLLYFNQTAATKKIIQSGQLERLIQKGQQLPQLELINTHSILFEDEQKYSDTAFNYHPPQILLLEKAEQRLMAVIANLEIYFVDIFRKVLIGHINLPEERYWPICFRDDEDLFIMGGRYSEKSQKSAERINITHIFLFKQFITKLPLSTMKIKFRNSGITKSTFFGAAVAQTPQGIFILGRNQARHLWLDVIDCQQEILHIDYAPKNIFNFEHAMYLAQAACTYLEDGTILFMQKIQNQKKANSSGKNLPDTQNKMVLFLKSKKESSRYRDPLSQYAFNIGKYFSQRGNCTSRHCYV